MDQDVKRQFLAAAASAKMNILALFADMRLFKRKQSAFMNEIQCQIVAGFVQRAIDLRLVCFEGLVRSALVNARSVDYQAEYERFLVNPRFVNLEQTLNHISKETDRAIRILDDPKTYTPRATVLYTHTPHEKDRPGLVLYKDPPQGWEPLLP